MTGEGIAAIIASAGGLITSLGTVILQLRQAKVSRSNSDKLDEAAGKIEEVHRATTAIQEQTGTHKALDGG